MASVRPNRSPAPGVRGRAAGTPGAGPALAVIPARGGSKRLPRKNVLPLEGRPLIAYTIEAALASGAFARVVVSTDDEEIAEVAKASGADTLERDPSLADDVTPSSAVTIAVLRELGGPRSYPVVAQLLPNCPLRDAEDVSRSAVAFSGSPAAFQVSVARFGWQVAWWASTLGEEGGLEPLFPDSFKRRSQDLAELYSPTGAVWWAGSAALLAAGSFYGPGVRGEPLAWEHGLDIDTHEDLRLAAALLAARRPRRAWIDVDDA